MTDREYIESLGFTAHEASMNGRHLVQASIHFSDGTFFSISGRGDSYEAAWASCRQKVDVVRSPETPTTSSDGSSTAS